MANPEQLETLKQGVNVWNEWRLNHPTDNIDFREADLRGVDLSEADLRGANLVKAILERANFRNADLSEANIRDANLFEADLRWAFLTKADLWRAKLWGADLSGASLREANLRETQFNRASLVEADLRRADFFQAFLWKANLSQANLSYARLIDANLVAANLKGANLSNANLMEANLSGANLMEADLTYANLWSANLSEADLRKAKLEGTSLVRTKIDKAKVSGSSVYATNVWDLEGKFEEQKDLVIARSKGDPILTIDNIQVAQFIYLIMNNEEIRNVINTLTSKSVLILGRFAIPERKTILDALRNKLREYDLLPIVFDFDRPTDKDFTETIKTLAGLSYFVIADVTNPKSSPLELQATVPDYQIPFVPIIQEGENPFAMMVDLQNKYNWVLKTVTYDSMETLIKVLKPLIIDPAMQKRQELRLIKAEEPEVISGKEYLTKGKNEKWRRTAAHCRISGWLAGEGQLVAEVAVREWGGVGSIDAEYS